MIKPGEIQNQAREVGVRDQQIEKDYILSWLLQGIAQHPTLSATIVFKGGTVLKKVYFEDYRFSEDLDFTLLDNEISIDQIFTWFKEVFEYVQEGANIPLEIIDNNEHQDGGINFYISYIGPLGGQGANKKVKVDIARSEKVLFESTKRSVILSYTDQEPHEILCYQLEEVLVEKLRSVIQRMQARDFYDIWYLVEIQKIDPNHYLGEFHEKCKAKGVEANNFHKRLEERLPQYKARWNKSLVDQIKELPNFEDIEREAMRHLRAFKL